MCSLHLDRPEHLHIHYCFWEKEPKIKNKRAAGYIYRKKGKIAFDAIANMTKRLNDFALDDELIKKRYAVERAIWNRQDFSKAHRNDLAMRDMRRLAKLLPEDISWSYGSKDMKPYRSQIDDVVEALLFTDNKLYAKDCEFRQELEREGMKSIKTIERLKWDYKRRLGNLVLRKVKYIRDNAYRYDTSKKHRTNDKYLKRKITIADRKIKSNLNGFLSSLFSAFEPEISAYSNRLQEIEKDIQAEHEQEQINTAPTPSSSSKWDWGK